MNKEEFIKSSDENLLNYCISDTVGEKGDATMDVILTIGKTQEQIEKDIEDIPSEELAKNPKISFSTYDILLTKDQLKFLLSEIERCEKDGPDYLDEQEGE